MNKKIHYERKLMSQITIKPKISIIIPVYNGEKYLADCLNSILEQSFKEFELIIINDGSTDNTENVIEQFKNIDSRIKSFNQENGGQGQARNRGLKMAQANYISFIDGDDIIAPNFLWELLHDIEEHHADIVICNWEYYKGNKKNERKNKNPFLKQESFEGKNVEYLLARKIYFTVNMLYRKDFLINNNVYYGEGFLYEDFQFFVNSFIKANKVYINPNFLYYVRLHEESATRTKLNTMVHYEGFIKAIENSLKDANFRSDYGAFYVYQYFLNRARLYSKKRIPKKSSRPFIKETFEILNKYNYQINIPKNTSNLTKIIMTKILPKSQVTLFLVYRDITLNKYINIIFKLFKR